MNEEEKLKDLKAVYSGAVQSGEIGIANMIKGGIDLIEKLHNGKKMDLISIIRTFKREGIEKFVVTKKETIETVLNLIEKQQAEIENAYWKGYTARDTEAQNICKSCKYRKP